MLLCFRCVFVSFMHFSLHTVERASSHRCFRLSNYNPLSPRLARNLPAGPTKPVRAKKPKSVSYRICYAFRAFTTIGRREQTWRYKKKCPVSAASPRFRSTHNKAVGDSKSIRCYWKTNKGIRCSQTPVTTLVYWKIPRKKYVV